jgi:hypothetical protein
VFQRCAQTPVIIVLKRNEPEWLEHAIRHTSHRAENLGHAVYRTSLRLEGNLDEVSFAERLWEAKQSARRGDRLQFRFCAAAVFEPNRSQYRIS